MLLVAFPIAAALMSCDTQAALLSTKKEGVFLFLIQDTTGLLLCPRMGASLSM